MPLPLTTPPEHICILRLSAIGDVTHVLPTLRSIQHQWPEAKITWIIGKLEAELVKDIPNVEFIVFDKSQGRSAYTQLRQQLKSRHFDVLLHMQISLRASIASLFIKAPIKLGFDKARAKNLQWLFTNYKIKPRSQRQHVLDAFLEFAHALGVNKDIIQWDIPVPEKSKDYLARHIPVEKYIAINPCTSARANNWRNLSVDTYASIIDYVSEHFDLQTVLTGGPSETEINYAQAITAQAKSKVINLVGKSSLKELLAILNQAEIVIAPDTGPLHMANACGTKVIGLYASSNPFRTGPYCNIENTVNKYPEAVNKEFATTVENIKWGKRVRSPDVMSFIKLDDVTQKLEVVLKE